MTHPAAAGRRPALVLVHGWGTHAGIWADLPARLGDALDVSALDLPGHGDAPDIFPYTLDAVVDVLAAAAPARCAVAGWSLGGQIALAWAHRHPEQVSRLLLISTTPAFVARPDWPHGLDAAVLHEFAAAVEQDAPTTLHRFLLMQAQGEARSRAVARTLHAALATKSLPASAVLTQTLGWLETGDMRAILGSITQPALVLHGGRDVVTPPAAGAYLARRLPRGRLADIVHVAHAPFISAAAQVCALITGFCNER